MDSPFAAYYKAHIFKESAGQRLEEIDFLVNDMLGRMEANPSPTAWNELIPQLESLQVERDMLAAPKPYG